MNFMMRFVLRVCLILFVIFFAFTQTDAEEVVRKSGERVVIRDWPDTKVGNLLHELEIHQIENNVFDSTENWLSLIKQVVDLGPDAVPELIKHLDETPDDKTYMIRSQVFILRAIGDRRATPALIRTILKCSESGGDYGARCENPDLHKFALQHDCSEYERRDNNFSYGRPMTEIFSTLGMWSGQPVVASEIRFAQIYVGETDRQKQLKRALFVKEAEKWEKWWEGNWNDYIDDAAYSHVDLKIEDEVPVIQELNRIVKRRTEGSSSGNRLESPFNLDAGNVFHDLDTGRKAGLPAQFKDLNHEELRASRQQIIEWAGSEGFDLMGWQEEINGSIHYQVWPINVELLQVLPETNSLMSLENYERVGNRVDSAISEAMVNKAGSQFVFVTAENTVGMIVLQNVQTESRSYVKTRWRPNDEVKAYFNPGWTFDKKTLVDAR